MQHLVDKHGRPLHQVWPGVAKLEGVQLLLDRNRVLIAEVNQNHATGTAVALERNVPMLRELNANIAKVVALYREAADGFVQVVDTARAILSDLERFPGRLAAASPPPTPLVAAAAGRDVLSVLPPPGRADASPGPARCA